MMQILRSLCACAVAVTCAAAQTPQPQSVKQFKDYIAGKLRDVSDEVLDAIAEAADKNSDGMIDQSEFSERMAAIRSVMSKDAAPKPRRANRGAQRPSSSSDYMDGEPTLVEPLAPGDAAVVLLIVGDELARAWVPFAEWKTQQGRATKILTVRQIARSYTANSIQEKIRLCVRQHIEQNGTRWVVLGGDCEPGGGSVPGGHTTYHRQEPNGIPTDIVYLSPTNWDADGDGRYGEWQDDQAAITYPDGKVGLGRIPVRTEQDVAAFTAKVKAYESQFPQNGFAERMLFTCTEQMATAKVRASWDKYIGEVWPGSVARHLPGSKDPSVSRIQSAFHEKPASKLHIHGHGTIAAWLLSDGAFTTKHVAGLSNRGSYPLITTVSCNTGEFDAKRDPSIVESMLRARDAGSVAIVAPIRTGKMHLHDMSRDFVLMTREGKLDGTTMIMTSYWQHGLGKQRTTGEALMSAKADMVKDARKTAGYHLCLCELNLLGDPTLDFRGKTPRRPQIEAPQQIPLGQQTIEIQTDVAGATISLRQGNALLQVSQANQKGVVRFEVDISSNDAVDVTVSGPNLNTNMVHVPVAEHSIR